MAFSLSHRMRSNVYPAVTAQQRCSRYSQLHRIASVTSPAPFAPRPTSKARLAVALCKRAPNGVASCRVLTRAVSRTFSFLFAMP
jgi:hypothetical protein